MTSQSLRPRYHFTPPTAWLNDPNGMVYHDGEYHLFYQYHPDSLEWGPMHWGHAVTRDLIHWEHLPIALYPDEWGMIFSGSAVVDVQNSAGFGAGAMVAIFTYNRDYREIQSLAYSLDRGRTWQKYEGNPVLRAPAGVTDFRDPKVFWYAEGDSAGHWVMALAGGNAIYFYTSPDLKEWTLGGTFGVEYGSTAGVWETPELFRLPVTGSEESRWVLVVAVGKGAIAGGSGVQYFVGDFNGKVFTTDAPKEQVLWADYGADFYAPQLWNHEPKGRRLGVAWSNNWEYARLTPATDYRGVFTAPREFTLTTTVEGIRLVQQPAAELQALRHHAQQWDHVSLTETPWQIPLPSEMVEIMGEWYLPEGGLTLTLQWGDSARVVVKYDAQTQTLSVDRTQSGTVDFHPSFAAVHTAPLALEYDTLQLHLLLDRSILELFANAGRVTFTEQIFPPEAALTLSIQAEGAPATMTTLRLYDLSDPA